MGGGAENGSVETDAVSVNEKKVSREKLVRLTKPDRSATDAQITALNEVGICMCIYVYVCVCVWRANLGVSEERVGILKNGDGFILVLVCLYISMYM